jgi:FkbM family methyltransferase
MSDDDRGRDGRRAHGRQEGPDAVGEGTMTGVSAGGTAAPPWRARIARWRAFLWRFHTLRASARAFGGAQGPLVVRRRLFGGELRIEVARSNVQRLLYVEGERFVAERRLVRGLLAPGMRVADVGANVGYYLLLIERAVGPAGRVSCFEPDPDNLRELRRNVEANGFANVEVVAAAAGASDGETALRRGINAAIAAAGGGDVTVPLVRLDSALDGPLDFLKIDVEGYEGQVLAGARRILAERQPTLFLEIHPGFLAPPYTVDVILRTLAEHYPTPWLFEISPQRGLAAKLAARYLGRGVRRVPDPEGLLADCRAGRRAEPFWAVCRPGNGGS